MDKEEHTKPTYSLCKDKEKTTQQIPNGLCMDKQNSTSQQQAVCARIKRHTVCAWIKHENKRQFVQG